MSPRGLTRMPFGTRSTGRAVLENPSTGLHSEPTAKGHTRPTRQAARLSHLPTWTLTAVAAHPTAPTAAAIVCGHEQAEHSGRQADAHGHPQYAADAEHLAGSMGDRTNAVPHGPVAGDHASGHGVGRAAHSGTGGGQLRLDPDQTLTLGSGGMGGG